MFHFGRVNDELTQLNMKPLRHSQPVSPAQAHRHNAQCLRRGAEPPHERSRVVASQRFAG